MEFPPAPKPLGVYRPLLIVGNLAYVSGHVPLLPDGTLLKGRVGQDVDQQAGYQAGAAGRLGRARDTPGRTRQSGPGAAHREGRWGLVNCTADFQQLRRWSMALAN